MNEDVLHPIAEQKKKQYAAAYPFPHLAIDNLFPARFIKLVDEEIPDKPSTDSRGCIPGKFQCLSGTKGEHKKNQLSHEKHFGPNTKFLFSYLKSATFIAFLEKLTGIPDLIPDPKYFGSGIHQVLDGAYSKQYRILYCTDKL